MSRFLRTTALSFIIVTLAYEASLRFVRPPVDRGQDQFATNLIRLENYADGGLRGPAIVGSSLSARLPIEALPPNWQNIALAGGSPMTGLEIIAAASPAPQRVLIEVNVLDLEPDTRVIRKVTGTPFVQLRRILWLSRDAYEPINIIVWAVSRLVQHPANDAAPNFAGLLGAQAATYARPPLPTLATNLNRMKVIVENLQREGVQIALFELPVDPSLQEMVRRVTILREVQTVFDTQHYCWLTIDKGEDWRTGDGIHLLRNSAELAAKRLEQATCSNSAK